MPLPSLQSGFHASSESERARAVAAGAIRKVIFVTFAIIGTAIACVLSVIGAKIPTIGETEVQLRLTADPFPGER